MNTANRMAPTGEVSPSKSILDRLRHAVTGRRVLLVSAVAMVGTGMAYNWSWLVAIGAAPVILALAPCAAMCALGVCMKTMGGKSCTTKASSDGTQRQVELRSEE